MDGQSMSGKPTKSIKEGQAQICLATEKVFYNPVQEFNRDLSIAVLTKFTEDYKAEKLAKAEKKAKNKLENTGENVEGNGGTSEVSFLTSNTCFLFTFQMFSYVACHCMEAVFIIV